MGSPLAFLGSTIAGQSTSTAFGVLSNPVTVLAGYAANKAMPVLIPNVDQCISLYYNGGITLEGMKLAALLNGVDMQGLDSHHMQVAKMKNDQADWNAEAFTPVINMWGEYVRSASYNPTIDETLALMRRKLITPRLADYQLMRQTGRSRAMTEVWKEMQYEIPGPSDLVRFAVREAFDPNVITQYGYHKEFPVEIQPWMEKQGYGQSLGSPIPAGATNNLGNPIGGQETWIHKYWYAHWELPSLTQGYEMVHRLYPSSDFGPSPDIINNKTFTEAQLSDLQRVQDIPDYWRERLQAISYHPITRTDASYLYENSMMDDAGFYHTLRGLGYNDTNAKLYLQGEKLKRDRSLRVEPAKVTKQWICTHYKIGVINDLKAKQLLTDNGYTDLQADKFLDVCKLDMQTDTMKEQIAHLRVAFLKGILSNEELNFQFVEMGVNNFVKDQLVKRWTLQKNIKYKQASALKNITFFKNGLINEPVLQSRLFNLGFEGSSISLLITNAKLEIIKAQTAFIEKQAKAAAKANKAAAMQAQQIAKQQMKDAAAKVKLQDGMYKAKMKGLVINSTDKNIVDWYTKGLVSLIDVYYRLYHRDFHVADADHWVVNKFPDLTQGQRNAAATKAKAQYGSEPNPPLVP